MDLRKKYLPNTKVNPVLSEALFLYQFHKASQKLRARFNQAIEAYNIISVQYAVMYLVNERPSLSQKELGEELGIDKASVVKFLDLLETEKYLTRKEDKKDKRVKLISLTPRGKKVVSEISRKRAKIEDEFLAESLSAQEIKNLREYLKKLMLPTDK